MFSNSSILWNRIVASLIVTFAYFGIVYLWMSFPPLERGSGKSLLESMQFLNSVMKKLSFGDFFAYFPSLALLVGAAMTAGYISKRLTDKVDNSKQEKTIQRARRIERICKTPQREPIAEGESLELEAFLSSLGIVRLGNGRVAFPEKKLVSRAQALEIQEEIAKRVQFVDDVPKYRGLVEDKLSIILYILLYPCYLLWVVFGLAYCGYYPQAVLAIFFLLILVFLHQGWDIALSENLDSILSEWTVDRHALQRLKRFLEAPLSYETPSLKWTVVRSWIPARSSWRYLAFASSTSYWAVFMIRQVIFLGLLSFVFYRASLFPGDSLRDSMIICLLSYIVFLAINYVYVRPMISGSNSFWVHGVKESKWRILRYFLFGLWMVIGLVLGGATIAFTRDLELAELLIALFEIWIVFYNAALLTFPRPKVSYQKALRDAAIEACNDAERIIGVLRQEQSKPEEETPLNTARADSFCQPAPAGQ